MILGFIDLQVNGYKGVDFSSSNLTIEDIKFVGRELLKKGIIGYCPTMYSSPREVYKRNLPLISQASKEEKGAQILGIHLEGPFINPEVGARGIHPKDCIIDPSVEIMEEFEAWAQNNIAIITLAPEMEGGLELIEHITSNYKTVVSIGHHLADKSVIDQAIIAGVRATTHVGNGLPDFIHRHLNPIWPVLADDRIYGFFITDGFHIPQEMIKVCLRAKRSSRFIVTSDMVHFAGKAPGEYIFNDIPVILEPNGYVHQKGSTQLVGSAAMVTDCMNMLASFGELGEDELYRIGYQNALDLLDTHIDQIHLKYAPKLTYKNQRFSISKIG